MKAFIVFFFLLLILPPTAAAQRMDSVRAVLGEEYAAGSLREFFMGRHWRSAWTTPFAVVVLDLQGEAGGLTPVREAGGIQSRTLYFRAAGGREFKFRAINTEPTDVWRSDVRKALINKALFDQITVQLPFAPVVAAELEHAVGLLTSTPRICALPDSPLLGAYRERFAGLVGTLELHPEEHTEEGILYKGSDRVIGTYSMLERLEVREHERVDEVEFCKARLMDVMLGDWDRDTRQWRWAGYREGTDRIWRPVPRDRDQAFSLFDGILPMIVSREARALQSYDSPFPNIRKLSWTGRHLDRRLLGSVTSAQWDSLARHIQVTLSDAVLRRSAEALPREWHGMIAEELYTLLKHRREELTELARRYYEHIASTVEVRGTPGDDVITARRLRDGIVEVSIRSASGFPVYTREFTSEETREIRLFALGGNDSVRIVGTVERSIDVLAIGGPGDDVLVDQSHVSGNFWYFTPIPRAEHAASFYDDDSSTTVVLGAGCTFSGSETRSDITPQERFEPLTEDRGFDLRPYRRLSYNSDDGLLIGGGLVYTRYGFRHEPYVWELAPSVVYATTPQDIQLSFDVRYSSIVPGVMVGLSLFHTELSLGRFYGYGNATKRDADLEANDFYRVDQERMDIRAFLRFRSSEDWTFEMGAAYRYSEIEYAENSAFAQDPVYGDGSFKYGEIFGTIIWDTRDHHLLPMRGVLWSLTGRYFPVALENKHHFADGLLDLRGYLPLHDQLTLALRVRGQNIWGRYPFFHAAYLGGKDDLRGFSRERFAGNTSCLGSGELRYEVGPLQLFLPGTWGLLGFADAGRVFLDGEQSSTLHSAWGGGLWGGFLDKRLSLSALAAKSGERLALYMAAGFTF